MNAGADRRSRARSEIVGRLLGSFETSVPARVTNVSDTGALLETSTPAAAGSVRSLELTVAGQTARVRTCVRHLSAIGEERNGGYAIGVEFVSPPDAETALVALLIAECKTGQ
jgi:hypothetical protein